MSPAIEEGRDSDHASDHYRASRIMAQDVEQRTAGPAKGPQGPQIPGRAGLVRVAIKVNGKILFIHLADIVSVQAKGKCVWLRSNAHSYLLRESISAVAEKFESHGFIRIHRSVLVNSSSVEEIRPLPGGEYCLRVKGGKEYTVSRTCKKNLKTLAELWIGASLCSPVSS